MARPLRIQRAGGRYQVTSRGNERRAFAAYHEAPLREGRLERVWDRVVAGAVSGSERFVAEVKSAWKRRSAVEVRSGEFCGGVAWKSIVEAVLGGRWEEFRDRYGDWGRDAALYLGRQRGRLKLEELARLSGGVGYTAVAQAIRRVRQQLDRDKAWRRRIEAVSAQLSNMKM